MEQKLPEHARAKHKRVTTRQAYQCVRELRNFETHGNLYGEWRQAYRWPVFPEHGNYLYVVKSYAAPIYVYDLQMQQWYANVYGYSKTTLRHKSAARPPVAPNYVSRQDMDAIANHGWAGFVALKMQGEC